MSEAIARKVVVELDLVGYSSIARSLEENLNVQVAAVFNEQIQAFIDEGLRAAGAEREQVVLAGTGDGAIVGFDTAVQADKFAAAVHRATQAHNTTRTEASAERWFRIGAATGDLHIREEGGNRSVAGIVITNAVRLESNAKAGELLIDAETYAALPDDVQRHYGPAETVVGKREERFEARRRTFVARTEPTAPATVRSVLELFDHLQPRTQLDLVMLLMGIPEEHRPQGGTLFYRQTFLLNWAVNSQSLQKLQDELKELIQKQSPRR